MVMKNKADNRVKPGKDRKAGKKERRKVSAKRWVEEAGESGSAVRVPRGKNFWNPKKEGTYRIDMIPFTAKAGNPYAEAGELYYERTYYCHQNVGPDRGKYICNAKTFKTKCAVCEYRSNLAADPDADKDTKQLIADLKPKIRQLFNIVDHDDLKKGVQIWDISFYNFGDFLQGKIKRARGDKAEKFAVFADPVDGSVLELGAGEETIGSGKPFLQFTDISFEEREEPISDEILEQAVCLDECIKPANYKELRKILIEGGKEDEDGDEEDEDADGADGGGEEDEDGDDDADEQDGEDGGDEDDDDDADDGDGEDTADDDDDAEVAESDDEESGDDDDGDETDEDADSDDDGDDDDESGEGDDDEDDEAGQIAKGDRVRGKYKGKTYVGRVTSINHKNGVAGVTVKGKERPIVFNIDELEKLPPKGEEKPAPKKKPKEKVPSGKSGKPPGKKTRKIPKDDDDDDAIPF